MMALAWTAILVVAAGTAYVTIALCAVAGRADAWSAPRQGDVRRVRGRTDPAPRRDQVEGAREPGPDDATARDARAAARGRTAWVFASPSPHGRLLLTGRAGQALAAGSEASALRVAGLAINGDLPVVVPTSDAETAFVGVPVPFGDGRIGALVVATGRWTAMRPWAVTGLCELAVARAELGTPAVAPVD